VNNLPRDKQIQIIAALTEGMSIRATERITGVHRDTIMRLAVRVGRGCAELHDRIMVGVRPGRIEMDETWSYVGKKQRQVKKGDDVSLGDQYVYVGLAATTKAIISYRVGKRDRANTHAFVADLRERVIGAPEISSDAWPSYPDAVEAAFGANVHYGQITKTLAVTDLRKDAAHRYSPAAVVAVSRTALQGMPVEISTSYVERSNLSLRMSCRRFTRLTNAFSKKIESHEAAVALYVAHYNLCRVHEALRITPGMAIGVANHIWTIGELVDAALSVEPPKPDSKGRRRRFRVIEGGRP
jgi:IS1 family transposase